MRNPFHHLFRWLDNRHDLVGKIDEQRQDAEARVRLRDKGIETHHRTPFFEWAEHHPWELGLSFAVVDIIRYMLSDVPVLGWLVTIGFWLLILFVGIAASFQHALLPCERCLNQPVASQEALEKNMPLMRLHHRFSMTIPGLLLSLTILFLVTVPLAFGIYSLTGSLFVGSVFSSFFVWLANVGLRGHVSLVHAWLRPWCPMCPPTDEGGGGGEFTQVPDPDPSMTKFR